MENLQNLMEPEYVVMALHAELIKYLQIYICMCI